MTRPLNDLLHPLNGFAPKVPRSCGCSIVTTNRIYTKLWEKLAGLTSNYEAFVLAIFFGAISIA